MSISVSNMIHYDCANSLSLSMSSTSTVESKTNLIVNYLPQAMNSEEIKTIFQSIGPIESCKLIKDKQTQQSLCFGFVNYLNIEDAEKAIKTLNGLRIENKVIKVSFARPSCDSIKGANLYVCGLPKNWSLDDFNQYFGQCGKIITSRIIMIISRILIIMIIFFQLHGGEAGGQPLPRQRPPQQTGGQGQQQ